MILFDENKSFLVGDRMKKYLIRTILTIVCFILELMVVFLYAMNFVLEEIIGVVERVFFKMWACKMGVGTKGGDKDGIKDIR